MARRDPTEEQLSRLVALREDDDHERVRQELERALTQKKSALVVARAAELVVELGAEGLESTLEDAFHRLLVDPFKRDKGCRGKTAVVKALVELERPASGVYRAGIGYRQPEPVWGGSEDVAAQVRGWCAHGLVRMRHADSMLEVVPLLVDPERPARLAAVDALGDSGQVAAQAVLRLKVLNGDEEPEVIGECFNSLLRLDAERSLEFVAGFLPSEDSALAELAALALGESRLEEAIEPLRRQLEVAVDSELRRSLYLGLSLTRRERAIEILVDEVEEEAIGRARQALRALALHRFDDALRERLEPLVMARSDRELEEIWRQDLAI